jgi:hypothetical protein
MGKNQEQSTPPPPPPPPPIRIIKEGEKPKEKK